MGSILVVPASIVLHDDAGFGDGKEDFLIETLVSEAAMKTLDKSIISERMLTSRSAAQGISLCGK